MLQLTDFCSKIRALSISHCVLESCSDLNNMPAHFDENISQQRAGSHMVRSDSS